MSDLTFIPETESELYYFNKYKKVCLELSLLKQEVRNLKVKLGQSNSYVDELRESNFKLNKAMSKYDKKIFSQNAKDELVYLRLRCKELENVK